MEELLERIRTDGPLSSTDVEPRASIDWYWRPTNQVRALLEALAEAGVLAIARREGNRRVYDLTERLFPPDLLAQRPPEREQRRHKLLSRYRGNGLLGATGDYALWAGTGDPAYRASLRDGAGRDGRDRPRDGGRTARVTVRRLGRGAAARRGGGRAGGGRGGRSSGAVADRAAGRRGRRRRVPGPAGPDGVGPRPAPPPLGLRLPLGGVRPGGEAPLGLLRAAAPVRRPLRRADRASHRPEGGRPADPRALVGGRLRPAGRGQPRVARRPLPRRSAHTSPSRASSASRGRGSARHRAFAAAVRERLDTRRAATIDEHEHRDPQRCPGRVRRRHRGHQHGIPRAPGRREGGRVDPGPLGGRPDLDRLRRHDAPAARSAPGPRTSRSRAGPRCPRRR